MTISGAHSAAAKPFLKWAGGKGQLLRVIERYYCFDIKRFGDQAMSKYAEPFVGGGAVLFDVLNRYDLEAAYISDVNAELIGAYRAIRDQVEELIALLEQLQRAFLPLDAAQRKAYYAAQRERFNELKVASGATTLQSDTAQVGTMLSEDEQLEQAALMIFLNKTCFNGLYRVNKKGLFNVPMGAYKHPLIADAANLRAVSAKLQGVRIVLGDYRKSADFVDAHTFVYFDPPYRPLTATASFTSYTAQLFDDAAQRELAQFVDAMNERGARIVVSNSDPKNANADDDFFDELYAAHTVARVRATRMINSKSSARGAINELLISNFPVE